MQLILTPKPLPHARKFMLLVFVFSFLCSFCIRALCAEQLLIRADKAINQIFIRDALNLALSKLEKEYVLREIKLEFISEPRHIRMTNKGQLDIFWQTTTRELERQLTPIRVPIFRGLTGYRILIIPKNTQNKFEQIHHIDQLKALSFGQSIHWPDTTILDRNGLTVVTAPHFLELYPMLKFGRFDALPRGLHQVWYELDWSKNYYANKLNHTTIKHTELEIERHLILKYIHPMYFFVSKQKVKLAAEIEKGMRLAIQDGSYQALFFANPTIRNALIQSDIAKRTIIHLENPILPAATPVDDKSLWFDPKVDIPSLLNTP